jgi:pimeloyl-ACP methyl ester carboxylesterase
MDAWARGLALAAGLLSLPGLLSACVRADAPPATAPIHVDCRGTGAAPTVILESGLFGTATDWDKAIGELAEGGRVCAYDRKGLGRSPPKTDGEDVAAVARELGRLLDQLGETRPVILVGHSNGALYVEEFAEQHPERIAGLVYVNGVNSDDLDFPVLMEDLAKERTLADMTVVGAHLGLAPLIADILTARAGLDGQGGLDKRKALGSLYHLTTARDEDRQIVPGLEVVRSHEAALDDIPLVVIVGAPDPHADISRAWRAAGLEAVQRARTSWMLDAPGVTHASPLAKDRRYLHAAVQWLRQHPAVGHRAEVTAAEAEADGFDVH